MTKRPNAPVLVGKFSVAIARLTPAGQDCQVINPPLRPLDVGKNSRLPDGSPCRIQPQHRRRCKVSWAGRPLDNASGASLAAPCSLSSSGRRFLELPSRRDSRLRSDGQSTRRWSRPRAGIVLGYERHDSDCKYQKGKMGADCVCCSPSRGRPASSSSRPADCWCGISSMKRSACRGSG